MLQLFHQHADAVVGKSMKAIWTRIIGSIFGGGGGLGKYKIFQYLVNNLSSYAVLFC